MGAVDLRALVSRGVLLGFVGGAGSARTPSMACLTRGWVMRPLVARFSTRAWLEAPDDLHAMLRGPGLDVALEAAFPMVSVLVESSGKERGTETAAARARSARRTAFGNVLS